MGGFSVGFGGSDGIMEPICRKDIERCVSGAYVMMCMNNSGRTVGWRARFHGSNLQNMGRPGTNNKCSGSPGGNTIWIQYDDDDWWHILIGVE